MVVSLCHGSAVRFIALTMRDVLGRSCASFSLCVRCSNPVGSRISTCLSRLGSREVRVCGQLRGGKLTRSLGSLLGVIGPLRCSCVTHVSTSSVSAASQFRGRVRCLRSRSRVSVIKNTVGRVSRGKHGEKGIASCPYATSRYHTFFTGQGPITRPAMVFEHDFFSGTN